MHKIRNITIKKLTSSFKVSYNIVKWTVRLDIHDLRKSIIGNVLQPEVLVDYKRQHKGRQARMQAGLRFINFEGFFELIWVA